MPTRPQVHRSHPPRPRPDDRPTSAERGYNARWCGSLAYLREHPLCVDCEAEGLLVPATVVDHVRPHKGDQELFWDEANWASRCERHHNAKTAREDGGFGRPVKEKP